MAKKPTIFFFHYLKDLDLDYQTQQFHPSHPTMFHPPKMHLHQYPRQHSFPEAH